MSKIGTSGRALRRERPSSSDLEREFADWYQSSSTAMINQLTLSIGDDSLAFEATADAYARAYEKWERVRRMENPEGWVFRTAMNGARRVWRRRKLERRALKRLTEVRPVVTLDEPPIIDNLTDAVAGLPPQMRQIIMLKYWHGMKEREIAEQLKVAPGTVAATLYAARHRLKSTVVAEQQPDWSNGARP